MKAVKVAKFEIVKPEGAVWDQLGKALRDVQYAVWKTKNRAVQMTWDFQQLSFSYKEKFGVALGFKDLGTGRASQSTDIYEQVTAFFPYASSKSLDMAIRDAQQRYKTLNKDVLNGNCSVPSFKRDTPIPISAQQTKLRKNSAGDLVISFPLLSAAYAKANGVPSRYDVKVRAKGSSLAVFNCLLSGEYALGDSQIQRVKSKWYVCLTYKLEASAKPALSPDNVMGVDMGVVNAAALAFNNDRARYFIGGSEIQAFRSRIEARRNDMLRQGKYCGEGRIGHGRATRLRPIEKLRDRVANFRATTNHRYAKFIVEKAVAHGCGTIQVEDLSGINGRSAFLKSWPYYDLQTKIVSKAAAYGIRVVKVAPAYTSQRCSCCGYIAEANRQNQAHFNCVACGFKTNADYNAARNIATPRIDEIIAEELRRKSRKEAV
ncbi:transposase [Paenibacillus macerans]|uniref:transposase n=1 Tax=Paenibacillus macerans TaxID=44252 RepID=UPI002DB81CB8|nr:transposase [Paenibacillus macerans]MEC0328741.1 transposase [Paenibacillus macerans]